MKPVTTPPRSVFPAGHAHPYAYALNNPVLYTDPSGEFVLPFLIAAGIGGVISAGADLVGQMLSMGSGDLGDRLPRVDWGQVGRLINRDWNWKFFFLSRQLLCLGNFLIIISYSLIYG
jgi:hypothetical protein